jgi:hypothetical protein
MMRERLESFNMAWGGILDDTWYLVLNGHDFVAMPEEFEWLADMLLRGALERRTQRIKAWRQEQEELQRLEELWNE